MRPNKTKTKSLPRSDAGFSLIEAIITVAIFLLVMAAIFGVLRAGNIMRNSVSDRSEIVANARTAISFIGKEAVNAGLGYSKTGGVVPDDFAHDLLKIPKDADTNRDIFPGVIAGNDVSESDLSVNGEKNDLIAFVSRDMEFNGGEPVKIIDSGQFMNSPYLTTPFNDCADCKKHDLYLIESPDGTQAMAMATAITFNRFITIQDNDPLGLNRTLLGDPETRSILKECGIGETNHCFNFTPHATAKRIFVYSYSVDVDGTLIRTSYGNNTGGTDAEQIQVQPLVNGVQKFQVRYLMEDGSITDDPSANYTNQMRLNEVVQVEISITIKSETNKNGLTSVQLITLDSTFSTRNLRYDFE